MIDGAYVRHLFNQHRGGHADHAQALWTVWMLVRWHALCAAEPRPTLGASPVPALVLP
jgi:hypothetical protein